MKKVIKDTLLKLMFNILKIYVISTMIYLFCLKEWKLKMEKLLANLHNKSEYFKRAKNLKQASNHKLVL